MTLTVDLSFEHAAMTGAVLTNNTQFSNVIAYCSDDPNKNCTQAEIMDWLAHGLGVALVWEDTENDMVTGDGKAAAIKALQQAKDKGYDVDHCPIFFADDRNTGVTDWPTVFRYMQGVSSVIPLPGYYGDQDSIDYLHALNSSWYYWQSDSLAYGVGRSNNAHLWQYYNDPRALSLPVDINEQLKPVPFMKAKGTPIPARTEQDEDMWLLRNASGNNQVMAIVPGKGAVWVRKISDYSALQAAGFKVATVSAEFFATVQSMMGGIK